MQALTDRMSSQSAAFRDVAQIASHCRTQTSQGLKSASISSGGLRDLLHQLSNPLGATLRNVFPTHRCWPFIVANACGKKEFWQVQ